MAKVFTITEGLENMGAMKTGGQGSVYKGRRIGEIITAIKILPTPIHSESATDRNYTTFQNEVSKLKKVNEQPNPNVVKILSSGITESGSLPFIEMEYIEGPDLEDLLKPPYDTVFTIGETLKVANHLSNALAHCHKLDVKHGDIKSNNVKQNVHSGNYVLLDFGLAIMSDEQRRTSLRHAGAVEFMAPEQNEGQMLFETDVYSFGVVLFELLAGVVPFPMKDKGETARNTVMLAHLENHPPNVLALRQQNLPEGWSNEKKEQEMQVPSWLVKLVYKCLEKKPADRFATGVELHDYIVRNSIAANSSGSNGVVRISILEQEVERLKRENEKLQRQLADITNTPTLTNTGNVTSNESPIERPATATKGMPSLAMILFALLIAAGIIAGVYYFSNNKNTNTTAAATKNTVRGSYRVTATRAYFHNEADEGTRRNAYATPSPLIIKALDEKNGFIYTEIVNTQGQKSKGWLRKQDMVAVNKNTSTVNNTILPGEFTEQQIRVELKDASMDLRDGRIEDALATYNKLLPQEVAEAMYYYGYLAVQNRNKEIDCKQGFDLIHRAGTKGFVAAKTTLGLLYAFADDDQMLKENNFYERCTITPNKALGAKLLMEATLEGDVTAANYLQRLNNKQ